MCVELCVLLVWKTKGGVPYMSLCVLDSYVVQLVQC